MITPGKNQKVLGNVCPTGWYIPTDDELTTLTTFLGGEEAAGGKLKETGTSHWTIPNTGATNETSFTALPTGFRDVSLLFLDFGKIGGLVEFHGENNS